uniref:Uncharacterized protein n=1 Tax=Anguilla anguilla TaxID=7936 RepID=A0A0E9TB10_ANGAN
MAYLEQVFVNYFQTTTGTKCFPTRETEAIPCGEEEGDREEDREHESSTKTSSVVLWITKTLSR